MSKSKKVKARITNAEITSSTPCDVNGVRLYAEVSDTMKGFAFRIRHNRSVGEWQWHYSSFATLRVGKSEYRLCSQYWSGTFPGEKVFRIEVPK